jgi:uncharacterized protein DUF7010
MTGAGQWCAAPVVLQNSWRDCEYQRCATGRTELFFVGGFAGQLVSSAVWFLSAALATRYSAKTAMWALVLGGMFIFPLTQLLLRLMARPHSLGKGHPMNALAMQIAFT